MLLVCLLVAAALKLCYELTLPLNALARGGMDGDVPLYLLVGRAILAGFKPYADVYESKPPGMFLLSALSLKLSGGPWLLSLLNMTALIGLPAAVALVVWRKTREIAPTIRRMALLLTAAIIALLLTLYTEERASLMETESFGACIGTLYVLTLWRPPVRWSAGMFALQSLLLLCTVGLKEPFLLPLAAAALLLSPDVRCWWRVFLAPLLAAGITGVVLLGLAGWLGPYIFIHLPVMLFSRPVGDVLVSLPVNALYVQPIWVNLTNVFPAAPMLGWLVGGLWAFVPLTRTQRTRLSDIPLVLGASAIGFTLFNGFAIIITASVLFAKGYSLSNPAPVTSAVLSAALLSPVFLALVVIAFRRRMGGSLCVGLLALYLLSLMILLSGYSGNHFAAAVPAYAALVVLFVRYLDRPQWLLHQAPLWVFASIAGLSVFIGVTYAVNSEHRKYWEASLATVQVTADQRRAFSRFDDLLDACSIDRFVGPRTASIYGRHAIWGPLPSPENFSYLGPDYPLQRQTRENAQNINKVVLFQGALSDRSDADLLRTRFTQDPPACAQPYLPVGDDYQVWFRKP